MRLALRAFFYRANQQLNRLGNRETWLLTLVLIGLIGLGQWGLSQFSGWQEWQDIDSDLAQRTSQVDNLNTELADLQQQQENPEQQELNNQITRLQRDIERTDEAIAAVTDNLISPDNMVRVLRRLLDRESGLSLVQLETLPVETTQATSASDANGSEIYRHAITLELEGNFNAVARYIQAVEDSEWQIYWHSMSYQIDTYPTGRLSLTLYTLSSEEGWLNV